MPKKSWGGVLGNLPRICLEKYLHVLIKLEYSLKQTNNYLENPTEITGRLISCESLDYLPHEC